MIDLEGSIAELRAIWGQGPGLHKRPSDLARYEILFERIKPATLIETGLYYGGSQIWFAQRVPHVINIELPDSTRDPDNQTTRDYRANRWGLGPVPENAITIEGDSTDAYTVARLIRDYWEDWGPVMVVLDSNHDTETVFREMELYSRFVTLGSYMVVEDGLLHYLPQKDGGKRLVGNWFDGDPLIAIEHFLAEHDGWEVDSELEDMFPTTQHPKGWLRRVK